MSDNLTNLQRKLIRCFKEVFDELPADVTTANMENTPKWDSMQTWMLVLLLQEQVGVSIGLDQIPKLTSFSAIAEYLNGKMAQK